MSSRDHPAKADKPRWQRLRLKMFDRYGWRCAECGAARRLQLDHIIPWELRPDLGWEESNLQPLCAGPAGCHAAKSRRERSSFDPRREAWRSLVVDRLENQ